MKISAAHSTLLRTTVRAAKITTTDITATTTARIIKPASGVAGTSSACYPSHPAPRKFI
jgi:hypothetical protein